MLLSMEVRWFGMGLIPADDAAWFNYAAQHVNVEHRLDHYFCFTESESLGIKVSRGNVELKRRFQSYGSTRFHDRVTGYVEHWGKWSFILDMADSSIQDITADMDKHSVTQWIAVDKMRQ